MTATTIVLIEVTDPKVFYYLCIYDVCTCVYACACVYIECLILYLICDVLYIWGQIKFVSFFLFVSIVCIDSLLLDCILHHTSTSTRPFSDIFLHVDHFKLDTFSQHLIHQCTSLNYATIAIGDTLVSEPCSILI